MEKTEQKISLADLGVNIPSTPTVEPVKSNVIRPDQTTGLATEQSNISDIAEFVVVEPGEKKFERDMLQAIDENIERTKSDLMTNVIGPMQDKFISAQLEAEANEVGTSSLELDPFSLSEPLQEVKADKAQRDIIDNIDTDSLDITESFNIDDEDLLDLMGDDDKDGLDLTSNIKTDAEKEENRLLEAEQFDRYKAQIKSVIKPIKNEFNLKEFTISTQPISINTALKKPSPAVKTAQWALYNTKKVITFSGLSGDEILNLHPENSENRFLALRSAYSVLYEHDVSPNKPATFEAWLKSICVFDTDEVYFAGHKATFSGSNYVTYPCDVDGCKEIDLREVKFEDMVKFSNDEFKTKFYKLLNEGDDSYPSLLEAQAVQLSDDYVFTFRAPTLYSALFETSALDEAFTKKYTNILSVLAYIDNVFLIDAETKKLIPIDYKPVPGNVTKTVKRKIVAYYNIIKKLTSDQSALINCKINEIASGVKKDIITYQIPAADCNGTNKKTRTKCTRHFNAEPQAPADMLFSRHQLVAIANFSNEQK